LLLLGDHILADHRIESSRARTKTRGGPQLDLLLERVLVEYRTVAKVVVHGDEAVHMHDMRPDHGEQVVQASRRTLVSTLDGEDVVLCPWPSNGIAGNLELVSDGRDQHGSVAGQRWIAHELDQDIVRSLGRILAQQ